MHNKSNILRIYIPRREGGQGLINVTNQYKKSIINTAYYINNSNERLIKIVNIWDKERGEKSLNKKATKYTNEIGLKRNKLFSLKKHQIKQEVKTSMTNTDINKLYEMELHGQYFREINKPHIDKDMSLSWNKSSKLKATTESTICAIQEQAITTKYIEKNIHKTSNTDTCRLCKIHKETIHHIISGCPTIAPTKYLERHDNVAKYIFIEAAKQLNLNFNNTNWYNYNPPPILENNEMKLLWNYNIQTDHQLRHNKPDIIIYDKVRKSVKIIDIAIPNDANIANKISEKTKLYGLSSGVKRVVESMRSVNSTSYNKCNGINT